MFEITIAALGPLALIAFGGVLVWLAATHVESHSAGADLLSTLMRAAGWTMLLVGILVVLVLMTHVFALFLWIATIVVLVSVASRFLAAEQQSLVWALTVAAERGIPLESAARAFAEERHDRMGLRAARLADYLEAGVPLALALKRSQMYVSSAVFLAADLGQESGELGVSLRQAAGRIDENEATLRWTLERLLYVAFVVLFGCGAMGFLMIKIMPVFNRILEEFELEAPPITSALISVSDLLVQGWPLLLPLVVIWLLLLVVGLCWYMGIAPHSLPIVNRLWWSADCAIVLHWLATAVRQRRSLADTVRTLASRFPQPRMRMRLERASRRIDRGADWCESLRSVGVIRHSESALFKTAERVGNLDWTLDEMANSGMRRASYRIRAWMNVMFPVILLLLGLIVLFITASVLMVLVSMIGGLL